MERTPGVDAAFIRELVRKAALAAADKEEALLVVTEKHLDDALQELLFEGGELARSLLGGHVTQGWSNLAHADRLATLSPFPRAWRNWQTRRV